MPRLDPELARLVDNAMIKERIGTDDAHINSPHGGVRFLSRIIHKGYGGSNPDKAARTLEGAARIAAIGQVPQTTLLAAKTMGGVIDGRLGMRNGDSSMILEDRRNVTGEGRRSAIGGSEEGRFGRPGYSLWISPVFQNANSFGMKAGNFDIDGRSSIGGIAFGGDATVNGSVRVGLMAMLGGGFAEGGDDLPHTTNSATFWGVGAYGGWKPGDFELSGDVTFLSAHHKLSQEMDPAMRMGGLSGTMNARALTARIGAGYTFKTGWAEITPHIGASWTWLSTDSYEIESGGQTIMRGEPIHQHIVSIPAGVRIKKEIRTGNGWVFTPELDMRVSANFGDLSARSNVRFTGVPGSATLSTQVVDPLTAGATLSLEAKKGDFAFGVKYDFEAGAKSTRHGIFATIRWEF